MLRRKSSCTEDFHSNARAKQRAGHGIISNVQTDTDNETTVIDGLKDPQRCFKVIQ